MAINILQGSSVPTGVPGSVSGDGPPPSIRLFERLQGTALVLGWANAALAYNHLLRGRLSPIVFAMALCTVSGVVFFLVARISRRGSTRCKWLLTVLSALGVAPWFALLRHGGTLGLDNILLLAQGALQFGSCALLVAGDSRLWFAGHEDD